MDKQGTIILGAGMTGLAAGFASAAPIFEAESNPGGICSSYYVRPNSKERLHTPPEDEEAYRFEIGGGHWIFGGDPTVHQFIRRIAPVKSIARISSVHFRKQDRYVPFPLQNNLRYLDKPVALQALIEMQQKPGNQPAVMSEWQEQYFGKTLYSLFFAPFHKLYTAGLWTQIAPQDAYKSPVNYTQVLKGAMSEATATGYNVYFVYPAEGLDALSHRMAAHCQITYNKRASQIDYRKKEVHFSDGSGVKYQNLLATLPLNQLIEMSGIDIGAREDPSTSVLVLNIGATIGKKRIPDHWLYIPESKSGFHRIGFYNNVDTSFVPKSTRAEDSRVSLYIERAFLYRQKPSPEAIQAYCDAVVAELQEMGFIETPEVVDPTWIDAAYTWAWPNSHWREQAMQALEKVDIYPIGRYARWTFQGIADSIRDGFYAGMGFHV